MSEDFSTWIHDKSSGIYEGRKPFVVADKLEPGYYEFTVNRFTGSPVATLIARKDDKLCKFSNGPLMKILNEIQTFWNGDQAYKDLGITHKRSILLYGPPGNGKTGIISRTITEIIARNGIAVRISNIDVFSKAIALFRQVQPDTPIVAIIEDIESQIDYDEVAFLEVLDGSSSVGGNVLYLSTTNNLDRIPERIRCRPSRMDTLLEIGMPCTDQRREYIDFILQGIESIGKNYKADLLKWSEGFSLADLKELVVSTHVYHKTVEEAAKIIGAVKNLVDPKKNKNDDDDDDEDEDN